MNEFNKRVQDAAEMFLKRRSYEILDTNWECSDGGGKFDIVAQDEDSIAFVHVKGRDGRIKGFGFDEATVKREDFERMSMSYLAENPDICDCAIRFDVIAITVVGNARAMIRHHINAMSCGLSEEQTTSVPPEEDTRSRSGRKARVGSRGQTTPIERTHENGTRHVPQPQSQGRRC